MDVLWFKQQQKRAGLTSFDLGNAIGRNRTAVSKIINGTQRMTLDQARIFADLLGVPIATMVEKAGMADAATAQQLAPGFSESDVAPWTPGNLSQDKSFALAIAQAIGGNRPGLEIWRVRSQSIAGVLAGDFLLVDMQQTERLTSGDAVIAHVYSRNGAKTVLRRFEPPVLVADRLGPAERKTCLVDGINVVVMGKVVASWRCQPS